jgi:DNA-binding LacI/PurR family transcriptional regulator
MALRGTGVVSESSRTRVLAAAADLGYRPNLNARRLASRRTDTIGVLISDLHNPLYAELLDGFDEHLADRSEQWLLASGFRDAGREKAAVDSFLALQVDAIVLLGSQLPSTSIQELSKNIPTVVAGRRIRGVDSVVGDDAAGVNLLMEHLMSLGHTSIAHVDGGQGAGAAGRRKAYTDAMRFHGLEDSIEIYRGDYTEESGEAAFPLLWEKSRPTAVFAANDLSALGILSAARVAGVQIPADMSIAGFDNTMLAQSGFVSLTTVGYSRSQMGAVAGDLLKERLGNRDKKPQTVTLTPSLAVRSTTGNPGRR